MDQAHDCDRSDDMIRDDGSLYEASMSDSQISETVAATTPKVAPMAEPHLGWTLATTSLGLVVVQLDITIVNVALPHIGTQLQAGIGGLQWVVDAYTLAFAAFLLSAGALADRLGSRGTYLLGILLFGLSSLACGIAPTTPLLIVARAVQGLSAAMIMPTSLSLIAHACGENHKARTRSIGIWSSTGGAAVAAGPVIGGFLIGQFGWRSIFLVNIPLCAVAVWWTWRYVAETVKHRHGSFDWLGQVLAIGMLFFLTGAVIEAGPRGWQDQLVLGGLVLAGLFAAAFLATEALIRHPMLPLHFFRRPTFSAATLVGIAANLTFYGLIFVLSLYFQQVRHYSPAETGLAFLPLTAIFVLANIVSGWLAAHIGFRLPIAGGLLVGATGFWLLRHVDADTPFLYMGLCLALIPSGTGITVPAMTASVLASVERLRAGTASAVLNTARQVGGAVGVALFGGLVADHSGGGDAAAHITAGLDATFTISSVLLVTAAVIALLGIKQYSHAAPQPVAPDLH